MPFGLLGHTASGSTDTNGFATGTFDSSGANLLVVCVAEYSGGPTGTITDSKGNAWTLVGSAHAEATNLRYRMLYSIPTSVGTLHTISIDGSGNYPGLAVNSWSGAAAASVLDQQVGTGGNSIGDTQPGALTPSADNYLVVTGGTANDTWTSVSGATAIDAVGTVTSSGTHQAVAHAYTIQTTAASSNPTWGTGATDNKIVMQAIFKVASAAGGIVPVLMAQFRQRRN